MSKYKELAKNTGIFALANFSSKILIFFLVPIYTRALSTTDYGFYDLVYSTVQLLLPILTLNISEAIMRFLLMKDAKVNDIFSIGTKGTLLGSVVFGLGLIVNNIFHISQLTSQYSFFIWVLFVFFAINGFLLQFAKGIDKIFEMGLAGVIGTFSMVVFNILFLTILDLGLSGFFIANIIGYLLPSLYLFWKLELWNYFIWTSDKELQLAMYRFSLPLILNTLAWWVNNTSDRYIVTWIAGVGANGLISVAYKIPQILSTVSTIFIQAWQISAIKETESGSNSSFTSSIFLDYNGLLVIIAGVLILMTQPLSAILFGKEFFTAWQFVPFLIISSLMNATAGYVGAILSANLKTKVMARSATYGMIANIVLNIIFALFIGIQGITIATMISSYIIFEIRRRGIEKMINRNDNRIVQLSWTLLIIESVIIVYLGVWQFAIIPLLLICLLYRNRFATVGKRLFLMIKNRKTGR